MGKQESAVEKYLHQRITELGGTTRKWVSPGHASVEDRICFFPEAELWFIEVKAPGEKPTGPQWREIMVHRMLGHSAGYLSSLSEIEGFLRTKDRVMWMTQHVYRNIDISKLKDEQVKFIEELGWI